MNRGSQWWELRPCDYYEQFTEIKIVCPELSNGSRFTIDANAYFLDSTAYMIGSDETYLLGVLNSSSAMRSLSDISPAMRGGYFRFKRQYLGRIPVPLAQADERRAIEELVQKCLDAKGQGPSIAEWEAEIDDRVAWLYGLSTPPDRPEPIGYES